MPAYFWCAHCSLESYSQLTCSECGKEREEKIHSSWTEPMDRDPNSVKRYASVDPQKNSMEKWKAKRKRDRGKPFDFDW